MVVVSEVRAEEVRGMTVIWEGRAWDGNEARQLSTLGDEITFKIANADTMVTVLELVSPDGVAIDDTGLIRVTLDPDETTEDDFPLDNYWYELSIREGDTGRRYPLVRGPWRWLDSPS